MEEESPYIIDTSVPKKDFGYFGLSNVNIGLYILIIIVIMYILYTYVYKSEYFTIIGELSDPAHDTSYLEDQLDVLNKMQEKNLSS